MARLGDVGLVITGNTPKTSEPQNYESNDICFVKPSDIADGMVTHLGDSEFYISEYARTKARILPPHSVLVTCIGIIGKVAINDKECAFNQQINAIVPNSSKCSTEFLAYAIQSKQAEMQDIANAPVVPILNKTQFSDIEIKLPPLSEQHIIVEKLNTVSNLIAMRKEQLAKLDQLVKSRFIELFGDSVTNSMGWVTDTVIGVCDDIYGGGTPSKSHPEYYENGDIPWVSSKDMKTDVLYDSQIKINQLGVDNSTAKMVPINSVIMVIRSGILKHKLPVAVNAVPITVNQDLKVFIPSNRILSIFLMHQFKMLEKDILSGVRAVTADNIEFDSLKKREIIVPPMELQEQFAAFVEQTDKSKLAIQQSLDKLELLKKSLMQEYFG